MSNLFVNQQFQPAEGLQPAIPFERPPQQSRAPLPALRSSTETPIRPTQVPPAPAVQPVPARRRRQQIPQPRQQPQSQQTTLDEQFRQAGQAYLEAYHSNGSYANPPQPVYHIIDPARTTVTHESPSRQYQDPQQQQTPETAAAAEPQQHPQRGLPVIRPQLVATPQQTREQQQARGAQDESIQEDGSGSDQDGGEDTKEADDTPATGPSDPAPLVQPITPLQYPPVRPTLLLGPYEIHGEAQKAVVEYAIAQGYMLVQSGCARAKTAWGGYDSMRPIVRVDLMCDRSGTCKNMGTGKRKRATHKIGCPTRIKVVCRKRDGCKWFIDPRCELHNHDLNLGNMESIASYRRYRRVQAGGPSAESRRDRSGRNKRGPDGEVPPAPVPPQTFHNTGPLPPTEPTGPVHMAALKGQVKILEILLNKGGDIDAYDSTGRTALHCAIEGGRMDAFRLLIERGADVSRCDSKGLSPLRRAVEKGLEEAVVALIDKGADPNK